MNRKIALVTAMCMLLSPTSIFADSKGSEAEVKTSINTSLVDSQATVQEGKEVSEEKLTQILTDIKKRFLIDDKEATFRYSVNYESGINVYNFSWENDKTSTYIKYGEDGNVYWYYNYNKENKLPVYDVKIKNLPKYNKNEAKAIAENFILKAFPKQHIDFKLIRDTGNLNSNMYNFEFKYSKNNIPVEGITAVVLIDSITGKISNFTTSLNNSILYESDAAIINSEEAKKAYKNELGMKLIYSAEYDYEKNIFKNTKILYVPAYGNEYVIDAKTGKRINLYTDLYNMAYGGKAANESTADTAPKVQLTEQEIAEIQQKAKLSSLVEVKTKINEYKLELLEKDMSVTSAQLYESKINTESGYIWSVNYASADDKKNLSVQLDAKTLELIGFSSYGSESGENKISASHIERAKLEADKTIKKYSKISDKNLYIDETYSNEQIGSSSQYVYLRYLRKENSIEFPENYINIVYDVLNNKILSYNKNWYDIKLPQPGKIISSDVIYDKIFKENQIELKYRVIYESSSKIIGRLIYEVNQDNYKKPLVFDAVSGQRIVSQNESDTTIEEYKDLSKSKYKDEISALTLLGIGFKGGELYPAKNIGHDEFLYLISQTFEYTPRPLYDIKSLSQSQKDSLEDQLSARGILDKNEKMQNRSITNQEAIKYLVRALGYEKLAVHTEIFKLNIADLKNVSEKYYGYVAIGDALDIIVKDKENKFLPSGTTTRDQALKMIYNYLK